MAYTFGGATTDDVQPGTDISTAGTTRITLVCGWWRPTTLTATRGLWSAGNIVGAEIDTTTDELRLRTDNTTDGQWTTAGVDLVVDEWRFIACLVSTLNGTPSAAWRVWAGSISQAPQECTVTVATSPSGNFTGSTAFTIGNKGTGTLAFQGDICEVTWIGSLATAGVTTHPFGIAAYGAITNAEAQWIYETMVLPIWLGEVVPQMAFNLGSGIIEFTHWSGNALSNALTTSYSSTTKQPWTAPAYNVSTVSEWGHPRPTGATQRVNHHGSSRFLRR